MDALHACDAAYLYVKQSFFWKQCDHRHLNMREKMRHRLSQAGIGTEITTRSSNELQYRQRTAASLLVRSKRPNVFWKSPAVETSTNHRQKEHAAKLLQNSWKHRPVTPQWRGYIFKSAQYMNIWVDIHGRPQEGARGLTWPPGFRQIFPISLPLHVE